MQEQGIGRTVIIVNRFGHLVLTRLYLLTHLNSLTRSLPHLLTTRYTDSSTHSLTCIHSLYRYSPLQQLPSVRRGLRPPLPLDGQVHRAWEHALL